MTYSTHITGGIISGMIVAPLISEEIQNLTYKYGYVDNQMSKLLENVTEKIFPTISVQNISFGIIVFLLFCSFGSLFPDIDQPQSKISRKLLFIPKLINKRFGHRGFIHTPFLYFLLFGLFHYLYMNFAAQEYIYLFVSANLGFIVGAFSHLILDTFNKTGIPWLYPLAKKKYHIASIKTRGISEYIFETVQIMLFLFILGINHGFIIIKI